MSPDDRGRKRTPDQNQTHLQKQFEFRFYHILITVIEQLSTVPYEQHGG